MNSASDNSLHDTGAHVLGLNSWPFHVVPIQDGPLHWADRAHLLRSIQRLIRRLGSHPSSTLHLLWADFGAGKTHTLLYLKQMASLPTTPDIFPVYAVLPKASRTFVDIYSAIVRGIGFDRLLQAYLLIRSRGPDPKLMQETFSDTTPGLETSLEALRLGTGMVRDTALRWLSADPSLTRKELYDASLPGKIRTTDEALPVLTAITRLLLNSHSRVLLMIDEFQRVGMLRRNFLDEINVGLHTYFNDCPHGLSLMLSFSFGSAGNIAHHLNDELRSRADPYVLTIPAMDTQSAVTFLKELVVASSGSSGDVKICPDVYVAIAEYLKERETLSPRTLMHAASFVFSEACLDLEDGEISRVEATYARKILDQFTPDSSVELD